MPVQLNNTPNLKLCWLCSSLPELECSMAVGRLDDNLEGVQIPGWMINILYQFGHEANLKLPSAFDNFTSPFWKTPILYSPAVQQLTAGTGILMVSLKLARSSGAMCETLKRSLGHTRPHPSMSARQRFNESQSGKCHIRASIDYDAHARMCYSH